MASDPPSLETGIVHVDPSERVAASAASGPASAKQRGRSAAILIGAFAAHLCLVLGLNRLDVTAAAVAQQSQEIPVELVTEPPSGPTKKTGQKKSGASSSSAAAASAKPGPLKAAGQASASAAKSQTKPDGEPESPPSAQKPVAPKPKQEAELPAKQPAQPEAKPPLEPSSKSVAKAPAKPVAETLPKSAQKTPPEPSKPPPPEPSKPAAEAKLAATPKPAEEKKPVPEPAKAADVKPPEPPPVPKLPELARLPTGLDPLLNPPVSPAAAQPAQQAGLPPALAHLPPMSETFQAVAVPAPTRDGDLITAYKTLVFSKLELAKRFPESARKRHAHGSAIIAFALDDQGHVKRVKLLRSSGDTTLDVASLALVERAAPFPPPPPGAQKVFAAVVEFDEGK